MAVCTYASQVFQHCSAWHVILSQWRYVMHFDASFADFLSVNVFWYKPAFLAMQATVLTPESLFFSRATDLNSAPAGDVTGAWCFLQPKSAPPVESVRGYVELLPPWARC